MKQEHTGRAAAAVIAVAFVALLGAVGWYLTFHHEPASPAVPHVGQHTGIRYEDQPGWDCHRDGNRRCGKAGPKATVAAAPARKIAAKPHPAKTVYRTSYGFVAPKACVDFTTVANEQMWRLWRMQDELRTGDVHADDADVAAYNAAMGRYNTLREECIAAR